MKRALPILLLCLAAASVGAYTVVDAPEDVNIITSGTSDIVVRTTNLVVTDEAGTGEGRIVPVAGQSLLVDGYLTGRFQTGYVTATSSTSALNSEGIYNSVSVTDASSSLQTGVDGLHLRQTTNTSAGNDCGWDIGTDVVTLEARPLFGTQFQLQETGSTIRFFVGLSDQDLATMAGADEPAGNYLGLQLRPTDSNFFLVVRDGTTLTRTDTGVAADTAVHIAVVRVESTSSITLRLLDEDAQEEFSTTVTTNLPAATTDFEPVLALENQTGGATRSVDTFFSTTVLRKP